MRLCNANRGGPKEGIGKQLCKVITISRPVIGIDYSAGVFFIKRRQQANGCALANMLTLKHELRKACFIAVGANQQRNIKLLAAGKDLQRMIRDRKSTRLNSSHVATSYAVFCLRKND